MQQANGGFLAHPRHAGDVVHLVAHQCEEVDDECGRQAKLLLHARFIEGFLFHGVDQRDVAVHQLGHVLIAGGDDRVAASLSGLVRQRANHVIRLDPFDAQQRQAECFDTGVQRFDLAA